MNEDRYIAAIEIGSSKVSGAIGRVRASAPGHLEVLAIETEHATESVSHGLIQNVEDVGNRVSRIVNRLERHLNGDRKKRKVKLLFAGLSGRSLRNIGIEIFRHLPEDTEISESLLDNLENDARNYNIDASLEAIDAVPRSFLVNKSETRNPVGICGNSITARYNLIVCRPILRRHLLRVVRDKAGLGMAKEVVTPVALANLVLSSEEKRLGCMLVDMGAETITVSLYKDNTLQYLAVLPMGSRNITTDITSLNVLEDSAEEMKMRTGSAISSDSQSTLNLSGVRLSDVVNLVAARSEELVANIIEQINYAGFSDRQLPGGIVMAGGGFNLNRLPELLRERSGLSVRSASLPSYVTIEDSKASAYDSLQLIAIMTAGMAASAPQCIEQVQMSDMPADDSYVPENGKPDSTGGKKPAADRRKKPGKVWGALSRFGSGVANIFVAKEDDDDDDTELT